MPNQPPKQDAEELRRRAAAGGRKSGEARRAKAQMREDLKARMLFVEAAEEVAQELLDAALGKGRWVRTGGTGALLDPKERAGLLKVCLEYGVGRPRPQDPMTPEDEDEDEPKTGFRFGVAEDAGDAADTQQGPGAAGPEPAGHGGADVHPEGA